MTSDAGTTGVQFEPEPVSEDVGYRTKMCKDVAEGVKT